MKDLHERRKITFQELGALMATRAMLAAGLLEKITKLEAIRAPSTRAHQFNMGISCEVHGCGSVSCIGGTMGLIMGVKSPMSYVGARGQSGTGANGYAIRSCSLEKLFYPPNHLNWDKITPDVAVKAIDNWLKTGRAGWSGLLRAK